MIVSLLEAYDQAKFFTTERSIDLFPYPIIPPLNNLDLAHHLLCSAQAL